MKDIKERVEKVNDELFRMGYSAKDIVKFWDECMSEAKYGLQLSLEIAEKNVSKKT